MCARFQKAYTREPGCTRRGEYHSPVLLQRAAALEKRADNVRPYMDGSGFQSLLQKLISLAPDTALRGGKPAAISTGGNKIFAVRVKFDKSRLTAMEKEDIM
ncbi:MAG: hypothetical protein HDT15_10470 [Oscillibacter sp.]|nr:hypothetical protein [Oscillibacter sp.]MBD5155459.1 hypothetical protein [Oscillibacter sp.]